jgi:hypothetical protein
MVLAVWLERCGPPDSTLSADKYRLLKYGEQGVRALFTRGMPSSRGDRPDDGEWHLNTCFDEHHTRSFWVAWDRDEKAFRERFDSPPEKDAPPSLGPFPCTVMSVDEAARRMVE